jgi:hypothetical protein
MRKFAAVKVPWQCPLVLLIKVCWRQFGAKEGDVIGN